MSKWRCKLPLLKPKGALTPPPTLQATSAPCCDWLQPPRAPRHLHTAGIPSPLLTTSQSPLETIGGHAATAYHMPLQPPASGAVLQECPMPFSPPSCSGPCLVLIAVVLADLNSVHIRRWPTEAFPCYHPQASASSTSQSSMGPSAPTCRSGRAAAQPTPKAAADKALAGSNASLCRPSPDHHA